MTLAWDDPAYDLPTILGPSVSYSDDNIRKASKLINNLDVSIISEESNEIYYPFVLDHTELGVSNLPIPLDGIDPIEFDKVYNNKVKTGIDQLNNVEVIYTELPPGYYQVKVRGTKVNTGQQDYSLIYSHNLLQADEVINSDILEVNYGAGWYNDQIHKNVSITGYYNSNGSGNALKLTRSSDDGSFYTSSDILTTEKVSNLFSSGATRVRVKMGIAKTGSRNPHYNGNIQLYLFTGGDYKNPLHREYIGQVELMDVAVSEEYNLNFEEYTFEIPEYLLSYLKSPDGVRISVLGSFNLARIEDDWYVDYIRFEEVVEGSTQVNCSGVGPWSNSNSYTGVDKVTYSNELYECIPGVTSPWCNLAGYAPGSTYWGQAWEKLGVCQ